MTVDPGRFSEYNFEWQWQKVNTEDMQHSEYAEVSLFR